MQGTVKAFSRNRGFGFITPERGEDIFVHHGDLVDEGREYLIEGQGVEFEIKPTDRGPRAVKVRVTREVPLDKERQLDWRGRRHGHPRPGELPEATRRLRGIEPEEEDEDEGAEE